jgi:hypothetical protein
MKVKPYFKAQYLATAVAFFFIFLYALYLITGQEVRLRKREGTFSKGDSGYFLFYKLFKQLGYKFQRWYEAGPPTRPAKNGCLVYFDYNGKDIDSMEPILNWVRQGNSLIMVGIHTPTDPIFSIAIGHGPAQHVSFSKELTSEPLTFSFHSGKYLKLQYSDNEYAVLLRSESGALVIRYKLGRGVVYLFPDNNIFINRNFINPDHAIFVNEFLKNLFNHSIYFHEYGTGVYRVKSPVMILFKGNLIFITLQLLLIGIVFAAWKSKRFGKPLHASPVKRRSLGVHLTAVGGFFQKTKAYKIVEYLVQKYFIYRINSILHIHKPTISTDELVRKLSDYTGKSTGKIKLLLEKPGNVPITERMLLAKQKEFQELIDEIRYYRKMIVTNEKEKR